MGQFIETLEVYVDEEERQLLLAEIDRLKLSNIKLIAELGEIAKALNVTPSYRDVMGRIKALGDHELMTRVVQERNRFAAELVEIADALGLDGYDYSQGEVLKRVRGLRILR